MFGNRERVMALGRPVSPPSKSKDTRVYEIHDRTALGST